MTVQQLKTRSPTYVADGVETSFPTDFEFLEAEDVSVYVDTVLVVGYSVTGGEGSEGTVVFTAPPPDNSTVDILRKTALTQLLYTAALATPATLEKTLDRVMRILQSQDRTDQQALRAPPYELDDLQLSPIATRAGMYLAFDSNGLPAYFTQAPQSELLSEKITLVADEPDYSLPLSLQSTADEDNYAVTLVDGGALVRGATYDFTVTANVLTLNTTPTVANGLAGEEILVELIRPGIDVALITPRSVGSGAIALEALLPEHFGIPDQGLGTLLFHNGTEWVVIDPPSSDGKYKLQLAVSSAGTVVTPSWQKGGLLNTWQFPTKNASVIVLSDAITDDDNKLTISEGTEVLTRTFTLSANVASVRIVAVARASCGDNHTIRCGLFRTGTTDALDEDRFKELSPPATNSMQTLRIDYVYTTTSPGSVTFSIRVGSTDSGAYLNADRDGIRRGGGNVGCVMWIEELGSSSA